MALKGRRFDTRESIIADSKKVLKNIPKDAFFKCFKSWEKIWKLCIDAGGDILKNINNFFFNHSIFSLFLTSLIIYWTHLKVAPLPHTSASHRVQQEECTTRGPRIYVRAFRTFHYTRLPPSDTVSLPHPSTPARNVQPPSWSINNNALSEEALSRTTSEQSECPPHKTSTVRHC
ncbi:hypothetical protein LAZ67_14001025 [Cordylochernes scorpioides]|uniref:Uncharacterized protein n=1 Tax=Cordylochernes scorpioides TaxID=51811 RepID=A0ABY6L5U7_9ARAC|nr:hypothetical protein LAZ67_14001025 [Cordylochernes scorpioides]